MKKFVLFTCLLALTVSPALADTNDVKFPDADKTYLKGIPRFDASTFVHITKDMHSDGVRKMIGNPHFNEFISNEWNYIVKIRKPNTQTYVQCQLQIHFDNQYVSDYYWNTPECGALTGSAMQSSQPAMGNTVVVAQESAGTPQKFNLSTDVLFNFDSSELKKEGRTAINKLIQIVNNKYQSVEKITVVGCTDRLGDNDYNLRLSLDRADAVRSELAKYGINPALIGIDGRGSNNPVTDGFYGMDMAQAKLCLAADRRVDVIVIDKIKQ